MLYTHSGIIPTSFGHALLVNVQLYSNAWPFILFKRKAKVRIIMMHFSISGAVNGSLV